ncbi:MAG: LuxR C-terminal-related transcriptional regulator [Planctomycetota bacterium]
MPIQLQHDDVRGMARLLGDLRELRHDTLAQEQRIVDGLCELVGAPFGWASSFDGFRPGQPTRLTRFVTGEVQDPAVARAFTEWSQLSTFDDDPLVVKARRSRLDADQLCRSQSWADDDWRRFPIFEALNEPAGIVDSLALWFRYPGGEAIRGFALQRTTGDRNFAPRELALARLIIEEIGALYRDGLLEPDTPPKLPARLANLVPLLLSGLSQKQIAAQTGLTYETVRSYAKELYPAFRVKSREELIATLAGRKRRRHAGEPKIDA